MKTLGIAAGLLVCSVAASAFAETPLLASPPPPAPDLPDRAVSPPAPIPPPGWTIQPSEGARDVVTTPLLAPNKAFELGVEAGYTQGFGAATSDARVGAGPGGTIGLSFDDRIAPRWSFGVSGQYEGYGSSARQETPATLRGMTAGVHGTYHASPYSRLDPHLTVGAGYRLLVESPLGNAPTTLTHGLELGKVEVGLDLRPSESVAVSPVIGADLNLFAWRSAGATGPTSPASLNAFVFAGVKGRFDIGGTREPRPPM
jgi:hypothetical protein